jgi:hypothetical protein
MATADLYGTMDPFQRTNISPKRRGPSNDSNHDDHTSADYQHHLSLSPTAYSAERGSSSGSIFSFNNIGQMSIKNRLKVANQSSSRNPTGENTHAKFFRSRSIDSMSGNEKISGSDSAGTGEGFIDDKPPSSATFAKTFRTLRKRLSRPSVSNKQEQKQRRSNTNELAGKSGGDDSEASSTGEEVPQVSVTDTPTSNSDLTEIETTPTAVSLKVHRSLPAEKTPSIVTSPPPLPDVNETTDDSENSYENSNLSKTWSSSTFTGAQLHGTCSLEYTEHMKEKSHKRKAHVIDLRKDDGQQQQQPLSPNPITSTNKPLVVDLPRSSSTSSMDNIISNESVCAIQFSESFTYKNDFTISPSVWLGTSTGCVIVTNLNINYEPRNISVVPSGSVFRLCGRLLHISFLDHKGAIIPPPSEKWDTKKPKTSRATDGFLPSQDLNSSTGLPGSSVMSSASPSTISVSNNIQYAVFCSSKQARVVGLPSQVCISKQTIYDSLGASASNVLRASVVKIAGSPCLTCYLSGGRIHVYSLPGLRELYMTNLDAVIDTYRSLVATTFTFTNRGHGLYMCSPTEIQKFTIASDVKEQIGDMLCEVYSPSVAMPEAPKQNFFAKLFASNAIVDSDQLFGEAAGKAPPGVVKKRRC